MKVAICHTDFHLYWRPRLNSLAGFLRKHDAELRAVEIAGKGSPYSFADEKHDCPFLTCLFPGKRMEDIAPRKAHAALYNALDKLMPDIVIAGAIAFPSGAAAVRWARNNKKPVIIMDDARLLDVPRSALVNWVKRRIYSNVDAMFIPAPSHVPDYRFWGIAEEQIFFGVNVVDNHFFREKSDTAEKNAGVVREKYGLPGHFFFGIGRQIPKKNWHVLIEAFSLIRADEKWGLVLTGDGPEADSLKNTALRYNVKVTFLPFQSQEDLCEIYGVADCFVLPSLYGETWGLVVNEAMACRLPVIVSNQCGCAKTIVRDGYNGWKFNPHTIQELAQHMKRFINLSDEERKKMGCNSWALISDWGLERFCEGVWQAVQYCVNHPSRGYESLIDRILIKIWKGRYRPV